MAYSRNIKEKIFFSGLEPCGGEAWRCDSDLVTSRGTENVSDAEESCHFFFKKKTFIYLFNFGLHRVLVAACRLFVVAFRLQGKQSQFTHGTWDLSSTTRNQTHVPCIGRILNHWTTSEVPKLSILVITFRPVELASLELNY